MADRKCLSLVVVGSAWPPETFIARLLRGLLDCGVRITVATHRKPDHTWFLQPGFSWLRTPSSEGNVLGRILRIAWMFFLAAIRSPKDLRRLASVINSRAKDSITLRMWHRVLPFAGRRWDVIYFPWNSAAIGYLPLFELGVPVVLSCRGSQVNVAPYDPRRVKIHEKLLTTFKKAAAVHCVSEDIFREAVSLGLDPDKAHVIRPAVDADFFYPASKRKTEEGVFRVVTTGALIWRKGYEYALLAIRKLVDAGVPVSFEIIGDGPERQRVLYTIHDLELENQVSLLGKISPQQVCEILQSANVFLLSSLSEGISNAVLEAMSCGIPVVTTDCGGMREAVTDGVEGFVVPMRDSERMAEALRKLWEQSDLRYQMGNAAREQILRSFTLEQQIKQFAVMVRCSV
jgi:colanic acid/amylovoran biosynthesis glycosyltransferase